jgi:hypothetical protein|nr:MAG: protein of unknown function DUF551 [Bacteriophage sp.]
MERNIDMGQTVEEAAHFFAESRSSGSAFPAYYHGFIAGAEWQANKSPWISVKERLPKENEMVLCRMVSNGAIVSGYIVVEAGKPPRAATSGNFEFEDYGDYECDMWMPIPDLGE